jgi:uncharacterized protein (DUF58 family)
MADNHSTLLDPTFLRKLETLSFAAKRIQAGRTQGARRSPKRGSSVEFADFREYALGDDLRSVDWKAYGRLEKLFLKLFVEEEDLSLHLLLDTSQSMEFGSPLTKADYARRIAAALGYIALAEYDRVSVAGFSDTLGEHMPPFFKFLQNHTQTGGETKFGVALSRYAARTNSGGIAVVLSDFFDDTHREGLKALLARRFQVVLIHILDPEEIHPTLTGDLRLVDAENGQTREVSVSPRVLGQYEAQLTRFCDGLKDMAGRYGMDYARVVTDAPFEDVILKLLRSGGVLR